VTCGGIQRLLNVYRGCLASTGVALCLYYMASITDVLEKVHIPFFCMDGAKGFREFYYRCNFSFFFVLSLKKFIICHTAIFQ